MAPDGGRRTGWIWRVAPAGVAAAAAALALYWVFLVPIFTPPDEPSHYDYALSIFSAGRLLNVRERPPAPALWDLVVHPDAVYLENQNPFWLIHEKLAANTTTYGTCGYYQGLDAAAPPAAVGPAEAPSLITQYPFGYYALLAVWLGAVHTFTSSVVAMFFAARILSSLLLIPSLLLTFGIARELGMRRSDALGVMALIGFFPMTIEVASYVQPDNLTFALTALSTYLTLRIRRHPDHLGLGVVLGATIGLLLVTKWHIYLCLVPWLLAAVVVARQQARRSLGTGRLIAPLVIPSLVLGLVQLWVSWGSVVRHFNLDGSTHSLFGPALAALHGGPLVFSAYVILEVVSAARDFYLGGATFASFWGNFNYLPDGDSPVVFGPPLIDKLVKFVEASLTLLTIVVFVRSRVRVGRSLIAMARRARTQWAVRLLLADPLFNAYLTFIVFMYALYVATDNAFIVQGRNYLPFMLPLLLVPLRYAPRLFRENVRRVFVIGMAGLLAAYCAIGSVLTVQQMHTRFYGTRAVAARPVVPFTCWALTPMAGGPAAMRPSRGGWLQ